MKIFKASLLVSLICFSAHVHAENYKPTQDWVMNASRGVGTGAGLLLGGAASSFGTYLGLKQIDEYIPDNLFGFCFIGGAVIAGPGSGAIPGSLSGYKLGTLFGKWAMKMGYKVSPSIVNASVLFGFPLSSHKDLFVHAHQKDTTMLKTMLCEKLETMLGPDAKQTIANWLKEYQNNPLQFEYTYMNKKLRQFDAALRLCGAVNVLYFEKPATKKYPFAQLMTMMHEVSSQLL